jgi:fibronectin type 3 domain-containing protein
MKKITGIIHAAASAAVMCFVAAGVLSCDMIHDSLSSQQEKTLASETGTASFAGNTWYYNGSSSTDMSGDINNTLRMDFGKAAVLSSDGLSGSFTITYIDSDGNSATVVRNLNGGTFSGDSASYYLDMSPVTSMLNNALVPSGELAVQVKVGGFVCNEGSQKGRPIDAVSQTINVRPLYSATTLSSVTFNTLYSTKGTSIVVPVKGTVTLASDAAVEVSAVSGSSLPDGLTTSDFALSLSSDGLSLLVTPDVELNKKNFTAAVTVSGIVPALNGTEKTMTFPVNFVGAIMSSDTTANQLSGGLTLDLSSMTLTDDGTNLTVALAFSDLPSGWSADRISIMIDDTEQSATAAVAKNPAGTYSVSNGNIDFYGYQKLDTAAPVNMTTTAAWTQNASDSSVTVSGTTIAGWAYYADSTTVKYVIPFASIGSGASSGHTLRVAAFATQDWSGGVYDDCPASAVTLSKTTNTNDTAVIDFNKTLSYTIGSAGETVTYDVPAAPSGVISSASVTADTSVSAANTIVSLSWSKVYAASSFNVYRKTGDADYGAAVASVTGVYTYTDTTALPATEYTYKITSVNASGESASGTETTVTTKTLPVPAAPSASASFAGTKVTVSWNKEDYAAQYKVYRGTSSDGTGKTLLSETTAVTYTDTVTANFAYYYMVSAVNYSGSESVLSSAVFVSDKYPTAFTVSQTHTATAVTITNGTSSNATVYELYYKLSTDTDYTDGGTITAAGTKTVSGLTMGKSYSFKVKATNSLSTTAAGTYAEATVDAGPLYPVVTLDGTLSAAEGWTDANVASVSTDSISGVTGCDISGMYVTNDETNLYIAVKFASAPTSCWDKYRVTVLIDNAANSSGSALTTDGTAWNSTANGYVGLATSSSLASGSSVEAQLTTMFTGCSTYANYRTSSTSYTDVTGIASTNTLSVSSGTLSSDVIEYAIPLADIGAAVTGNTVYVYSAFSGSWWSSSEVTLVDDHIPAAAGTLSTVSNTNDTDAIDMTSALSYTIK